MIDFKRAILIGNSTFPEDPSALPQLRCPQADVEAIQTVLSDESRCWFNPIHTLLDAAHNEIFMRINEVLRDAEKEDLILVYYSGHGLLDAHGKLYLAANNTKPSLLLSTAVSVAAIRDCLRQSSCQRFVLILDCCYAGAMHDLFSAETDGEFPTSSDAGGIGEFVMAASTAIQRAEQAQDDKLSLFTKYLVEAIASERGDLDGDGVITLSELFDYAKERVAKDQRQEPRQWVTGSARSFILARTQRAQENRMQATVAEHLDRAGVRATLPDAIITGLEEMVTMDVHEFRSRHNAAGSLAYGWARREITTEDFIDHWYRIRSELSGVDKPADVPVEKRWRIVNAARPAVLDLVGPTYLLDANFHFLDWNAAFDEIVAMPLRLLRGTHAENFVIELENSHEVIPKSKDVFQEDQTPLVHSEILSLRTERHGLIEFRKMATQIAETSEHGLVWCVTLNIERADESELLWDDVQQRLREEANWSRYAVCYDQLLLNFTEYDRLLKQVTALIGPARRCADLGAGTGNSTLALLDAQPERQVSAFENNELMLQHLRSKIKTRPDASRWITVYKGDVMLSLREFPENSFDGALMLNALYALDEPDRFLQEVFRVLQPGATLALSTSHRKTNIDTLFTAIRADLEKNNRLEALESVVNESYERHVQMLHKIQGNTREEIIAFLHRAGFEITTRIDSTYGEAVMVVAALKPLRQPDNPPPAVMSRDGIFISYSHKDRPWLERIQTYLMPAIRKGRLKLWDDTNLRAGDEWRAEIQSAIDRARVAILLVSQNFLQSDFITSKELPAILNAANEAGVKIIWLLLTDSPYEVVLGDCITEIQSIHPVKFPLDSLTEPEQNSILTKLVRRLMEFFPETSSLS